MRADEPLPATTGNSPPEWNGAGTDATYAVGIVNFRTYDDLERCLASVKTQTVAPAHTVVFDANSDAERRAELEQLHPWVDWQPGPNVGYAAGANRLLERIAQRCPESRFALVLNPDVKLDAAFAENLLRDMVRHPEVALATGKLMRPDNRTIDSAGITLPAHRRPKDRGSGELDRGQYERREELFGASGAAIMLRRSALPDLAIEGEVFDEDFFVYHEDTDLSWRANLLAWRVLYAPNARAVHSRRWRPDQRFDTPVRVRRHSFKNHYLQILKNERPLDLLKNLPAIAAWEIARLGFALTRDRAILPAYADALRLAPRAWKKRRILQRRAKARRTH